MRLTADDWPLVQPTEVHVAVPPVHTAEPVLTPLGNAHSLDYCTFPLHFLTSHCGGDFLLREGTFFVNLDEPNLTFSPDLEQIKRKDEEVRRALADKEDLVADLLSIPREEYKLIADMASEVTNNKSYSDKEPSELVLAAVFQSKLSV